MWIAVVVLAALVVVLGGVLIAHRRRAGQQLAEATQRGDRLDAEAADLRTRLEEATATADRDRAEASAQLERARVEQREIARQLAEAEARGRDTGRELHDARRELEAVRSRAESAEQDRDRLQHELVEAESRNARLRLRLDHSANGAGELEALWRLELARSERTWRYSVAPLPLGPSPFAEAADPLRLAVEVEAAALREEVGAPLDVRWDVPPVADPGHALLVLRLAQELLAAAAREGQVAVLAVTGDDDITLHLTTEDGEPPLEVEVPSVADPLVTVDEGVDAAAHGLRLVVHQDRSVPLS